MFHQTLFLVLSTLLFLLPLMNAWLAYPLLIDGNVSVYAAMAGKIPWSDAAGHYSGVHYLLEEGHLNAWNTRRPLAAILLATNLWLGHGDFHLMLVVRALLCGLACSVLAWMIAKRFGFCSGLVTLTVQWLYAWGFVPTTLTEITGLTWGAFASILLWQGFSGRSRACFLYGLWILTLAFQVRPGALFVLPILVLWSGRFFSRLEKKYQLSMAVYSFLTVLAGLLVNLGLAKVYGDPEGGGQVNANFAYVLFGLVHGGKTWSYVLEMFPDLAGTEREKAIFLYQESWKAFLTHPWLILVGFARNLASFVKYLGAIFRFVFVHPFLKHLASMVTYLLFLWIGIRFTRAYRAYKPYSTFLAGIFLGILCSVLWIWRDGDIRAMAVTIPMMATMVGVGLSRVRQIPLGPARESRRSHILYGLIGAVLVVSMILPPWIRFTPPGEDRHGFTCKEGERMSLVRNVHQQPHRQITASHLSERGAITWDRFEKTLKASGNEYMDIFLNLPHDTEFPFVLALVYDLRAKRVDFIVSGPDLFQRRDHLMMLCSQPLHSFIHRVTAYQEM